MINISAKISQILAAPGGRRPWLGALSTTIVLAGLAAYTPQPSQSSALNATLNYWLGAPAYAQSPAEITKYAKAAYEIERLRQTKYAEAKRLMGNVPGDVCRQDIPPNVRSICNDFLSQSRQIIEQNGLTVGQFNDITRKKDRDANLQQQIQRELERIKRG